MRSKKSLILLVVWVAVISFASGRLVTVSTDIITKVSAKANVVIGDSGQKKTNELIRNIDTDINRHIVAEVDPIILEKALTAEQLLELYYQTKLAEVTSENPEVLMEIDRVKDSVVEEYMLQIDEAFNAR